MCVWQGGGQGGGGSANARELSSLTPTPLVDTDPEAIPLPCLTAYVIPEGRVPLTSSPCDITKFTVMSHPVRVRSLVIR